MSSGKSSKMAPSWKSFASASSRLKDHINQRDFKNLFDGRRELKPGDAAYVEGGPSKQSWGQWAGEKIRRKNDNVISTEQIWLFPGWATRRYHNHPRNEDDSDVARFSLDVFVSGYASMSRPPEFATRSQKAFMRLAKAFAALPKLPVAGSDALNSEEHGPRLSRSTEDLLANIHLPPTPSEITEETEVLALEHQFRHAEHDMETGSMSSTESDPPTPTASTPTSPATFSQDPELSDLRLLHANLSSRLQPFWSSAVPNRVVRLSIYTSPPRTSSTTNLIHDDGFDRSAGPVSTHDILTSGQGAFQMKCNIPWERICKHPSALQVAFGHPQDEHDVYVMAELLPHSVLASIHLSPEVSARSMATIPITQSPVRLISDIDDTIKLSNILGGARAIFRNVFVKHLDELVIKGMGDWYMYMWTQGVRFHYVSNGPFELLPVINDFIKISNLPQGSIKLKSYAGRSLFNGLLSQPAMRKRDGLVEILDNFQSSQFILVGDTGEQDLELYAALASERHKQILAVFIRDASGEGVEPLDDPTGQRIKQSQWSSMIPKPLGTPDANGLKLPQNEVFSSGLVTSPKPLPTPTPTQQDFFPTPTPGNQQAQSRDPARRVMPQRASSINTSLRESDYFTTKSNSLLTASQFPPRSPSMPSPSTSETNYFNSQSQAHATTLPVRPPEFTNRPLPSRRTSAEIQYMTPIERKRYELQMRVYKARMTIPSHIPLRIFREPEECVEAAQILDTLARQHDSS